MKLVTLFEEIVAKKSKVLIIGLGITGIESAIFIKSRGAMPVCIESMSADDYEKSSKFSKRCDELRALGIQLHFGVDANKLRKLLKDIALCIISPGVPLSHPLVFEVQKKKIPTTGEFELGVELSGLPSIMVTGSNGKSTVVTLIHEMLKAGGKESFLCGNIGEPVISHLQTILPGKQQDSGVERLLVLEASSYQLESCEILKPKLGVFLNLSNNHLERHGSMEAYFEAKRNLFVRQDSDDLAVVNTDDPYAERLVGALRARIVAFGRKRYAGIEDYAQIEYDQGNGIDRIKLSLGEGEEIYECGASKLLGRHSRFNLAAAIVAARSVGISCDVIQRVITGTKPLPHRIELVADKNSVLYINDSKSTTVASSCAAVETLLEIFPPKYLVLLLGGLAKKASWEPLLNILKANEERLRGVICFGKDGGMIKRELKRVKIEAIECANLSDAVQHSVDLARHNDVVILSPGCASFDEFKDFEERGTVFKNLVSQI